MKGVRFALCFLWGALYASSIWLLALRIVVYPDFVIPVLIVAISSLILLAVCILWGLENLPERKDEK